MASPGADDQDGLLLNNIYVQSIFSIFIETIRLIKHCRHSSKWYCSLALNVCSCNDLSRFKACVYIFMCMFVNHPPQNVLFHEKVSFFLSIKSVNLTN